LINDIDIPQTEARIAAYRAENAALTELNIQREEQSVMNLRDQEEYERQQREQRALEARREEEEEREEREKLERELIDKLQTSNTDASKLVAKARAEAHKRSRARNASAQNAVLQTSRSLRLRTAQNTIIPDVPHVPLQDDWYAYDDKYVVGSSYYDPTSEAVRKDKEGIMRAGGYLVEEAWERALRSAAAGLEILPLSEHAPPLEDVIMTSA
jgi:CDK-activating kinase assembly factor MAT1